MKSDSESFLGFDDSELWNSFRAGDRDAYTKLMKKYSKAIFNYGYRFCQDRNLLKDCIQDVFFELWNRKEKIRAAESVKWYLFKAVRLRIFQEQSKWNKSEQLDENYNFLVQFNIEAKIIDDHDLMQLSEKIKKVLNTLPARQKEILYLRFYEGLNFEDISAIMGISKQSLYNLTQKAYKGFRTEWALLTLLFLSNILTDNQ